MEPEERERARKHMEIERLDFISRLPDSILHHILSFLPARDVTSTSVLSRTLNRVWSTYPFVVFHFTYNNSATEQEQLPDDLHMGMQKQDFFILIERSVRRRLQEGFHIQRFQLYIDFPDIELLTPNMDQWIGTAVERIVPELALRLDCLSGTVRSFYSVPQFVLVADSLKVLSLSGCRFEDGLEIKLPHLCRLSISRSCFATKFLFQKILSGCPAIEYVKMSFCKWMDTVLSVSSLTNLKNFEFLYSDEVDSIKIDVSNLQTFSFASSVGNWPRSIDLVTCTALKELKLRGAGYTANWSPQPLISQLPALEVLEFRNLTATEAFRISSQRLQRLVFRDCRKLSVAEIDTPNLEFFEYCCCDDPFIPVKGSNQLQIHLIFSLGGKTVDWLVKLKLFLSKLSHVEDLKFIVHHHCRNMIIHQKLSEVRFSSLCHLMHPNSICISSKSYADLLNELFPSAYPKTMFVIYSSSKIIELLSQKVKDLGNDPTLLHRIVDFEVNTSEDIEHPSDPAIEFFIQAHSTTLFKTAAIKLNWKYDVPRGIVTL